MAIVTKRFGSGAEEKDVEYTIGDNCTVNFSVSSEGAGWLSWEQASGKKIKVKVTANGNSERTGYIIANVNGSDCSGDKRLKVVQDPSGGGGGCECSSLKFYDNDTEITKLDWTLTDTSSKTIKFGAEGCEITDVNATIQGSSPLYFNQPTTSTTSNGFISITISRNSETPTTTVTNALVLSCKSGTNTCGGKNITLNINGGSQARVRYAMSVTTLNEGGAENQTVGTYTVENVELFDYNSLSMSSPEWLSIDLSQPVNGVGNIVASYSPAVVKRTATVGMSYRAEPVDDPTDVEQNPVGQFDLSYDITATTLNICGDDGHVIGHYYYGNGFDYITTASLSLLGQRPDWVYSFVFGAASNGTGEIIMRYGKNDSGATRKFENITLLYDSYYTIPLKNGTTNKTVTQAVADSSCDPVTPTDLPNSCAEGNFYHFDNPYAGNMDHFYFLEHKVSAYAQDYVLGTWTDGQKSDGTYLIIDNMWEDVRIEIYDVTPMIAHRAHCGNHYIAVDKNKTFEQMKTAHENGNCPCTTPHSGEYVVEGYSDEELIAVYEGRDLVSSTSKYDNFWFKLDENSIWSDNTGYNIKRSFWGSSNDDYRGISFSIQSNVSTPNEAAIDRCAIIKVYPKIGGQYCTSSCNCESEGRCNGNKCTCVTDMVTQEAVDCSVASEYFNANHAYFNRYTTSKWGEALTNQMIYTYWWGPCDDTGPYIDTVDVYDALVTVTYDGNVRHTQTVGEYLGTVCAAGVTPSSDRTTFTSDDCISSISITSEYDSDTKLNRGWIRVSTNAYSPEGIGEYDDDRRYRTRILVPYHSGVNYEGWPFNRGEEYYNYYGPKRLNQSCVTIQGQVHCTPDYNGIDNGAFCVIEQDGFKTNS